MTQRLKHNKHQSSKLKHTISKSSKLKGIDEEKNTCKINHQDQNARIVKSLNFYKSQLMLEHKRGPFMSIKIRANVNSTHTHLNQHSKTHTNKEQDRINIKYGQNIQPVRCVTKTVESNVNSIQNNCSRQPYTFLSLYHCSVWFIIFSAIILCNMSILYCTMQLLFSTSV
jgi:hypothetical protein